MALSSLAQRVATAVVLVPLVLAALFLLPPLGWSLFVLAIVLLAAWEWGRLCKMGDTTAYFFAGTAAAIGLAMLAAGRPGIDRGLDDVVVYAVCLPATAFWFAVAPRWLAVRRPTAGRWSTLAAGMVVLLATWVALVELHSHSPWLVLAAMATVWIADTAAYFSGRRFGRRKLAPSISPNKTWEGVWGAFAAVALYALVLAMVSPSAAIPARLSTTGTLAFVACVVLIAAVSIVGDLFESHLKRQAGVKDSGTLLPGHGGVLDRVDALLAAMPLAALAATAWLASGDPS